jgi:glyoxylase-like metal-dependent hydrolase (beta-lactamase superfamily II)
MGVELRQISPHVYWMPPDVPDRPSLCAVVGGDCTVMLDGGASAVHARQFLNALADVGVPAPRYTVLTHWHWDHVFGAAEIGAPVIAHNNTAQELARLAGYDWDDAALDTRVASGTEIAFCADNIKLELPAPRTITIKLPEIIFDKSLQLDLGGVICHIQHVGGDHAADSCIMHITSDNVLFLGDCLYDAIYAPVRHYTVAKLLPLLNTLSGYEVAHAVEGHNPERMDRVAFSAFLDKMRLAATLVHTHGADEARLLSAATAHLGAPPDDDMRELFTLLIAGK